MRLVGEISRSRTSGPHGWIICYFKNLAREIKSAIDTRFEEARVSGVGERRLRGLWILLLAGPPAAMVLGLLIGGVAVATLGLALTLVLLDTGLRRAIETERSKFRKSFPDAVDLLAIALMAGMNPYRAFRTVGSARPTGCEKVFEDIEKRLRSGATVTEALRAVAHNEGNPELAALYRAIAGAERLGYPLGPTLMRLSGDLREREIRFAQSQARKAPVKVLFPLVFCVLPAFVLLTVVPVLVDTFTVIRE